MFSDYRRIVFICFLLICFLGNKAFAYEGLPFLQDTNKLLVKQALKDTSHLFETKKEDTLLINYEAKNALKFNTMLLLWFGLDVFYEKRIAPQTSLEYNFTWFTPRGVPIVEYKAPVYTVLQTYFSIRRYFSSKQNTLQGFYISPALGYSAGFFKEENAKETKFDNQAAITKLSMGYQYINDGGTIKDFGIGFVAFYPTLQFKDFIQKAGWYPSIYFSIGLPF